MSLIYWWPFNGNTNDIASGSWMVSGVTFSDNGKIGNYCLKSLTTLQTPITIGELDPLNKSFAFSFWVKINEAEVRAQVETLTGGDNTPTGSLLGYNNYGGFALTWKADSITSFSSVRIYGTIRGSSVPDGIGGYVLPFDTWTHVTLVNDASVKKISLYINGKYNGSRVISGFTSIGNADKYVVINSPAIAAGNGPRSILPCYLNDVRIYDHALSVTEVEFLAQGLVAHYPLKAPFLPNLLQGAEQYTKENPLVRNVTDSTNLTDSYKYHNDLTAEIKYPGKYLFVLSTDGSPSSHIVNQPAGTVENKKYSIWLQLTSSAEHNTKYRIWDGGHTTKDGRHYGIIELKAAGTYNVRTNLYLYQGLGNYTVKFWDMQLFECDKYIPETLEPVSISNAPTSIRNRLELDKCFSQDTSGYGNHAIISGTIVGAGGAKKTSSCASFDGTSYLICGKTPKINGDTITISCWGYMDNWAGYAGKRLLSCTEGGGWNFESRTDSADGEFCFAIAINKPQGTTPYTYYNVYDQRVLEDKTTKMGVRHLDPGWHHFCGTFDGLVSKLYIDGVEVGKTDYLTENYSMYYNPSNGVFIGAEAQSSDTTAQAGTMFNGKISDVRIYATALPADEVAALYINTDATAVEFIESNFTPEVNSLSALVRGNFTEIDAPLSNMKIKTLPDRTVWARIHSLDLTEQNNVFQDSEEVDNCDAFGKYSKMSLVDEFKKNSLNNYEFMLTYPTLQAILPSEYIQLEYVESDGQQYVDTDVTGGARWEFDVQFNVSGSRQLMGYGGSSNEYWGIVEDGNYGLAKGASWGSIVVPNAYAGKRDIVVHSYNDQGKYHLRAQDAQVTLSASVDVTSKKYMLFALNSSLGGGCYAKIYGCNCVQNGQLIRKFVPALRSSDNVAGLYDLVNKQFYTSGSGTHLLAGPKMKKFKPLEFLESTGEQYINTGFTINTAAAADVFMAEAIVSVSSLTNERQFLFAFDNPSYNHYAEFNASGIYGCVGNYIGSAITPNTKYQVKMRIDSGNSTTLTINGVSQTTTAYAGTIWGTFNLFRINDTYKGSKVRIHQIKMTYNGQVIREYIPVADEMGELGMLDLIENKFYTNAGTGTFVKPEYTQLEYIESTGTQYINTGVVPSETLETEISFIPTDGLTEHAIFGSSWATNGYFLMFYNNKIRWHSGGKLVDIGSYSAGDKVICHCANKYIIVNGITYLVDGGENTTGAIKILDNMGYTNQGSGKGIGKIEYIKMWENGVLIRDFIPVQKDDGVVCLYDKQNKQYYTNAGTGVFMSGPRVELSTSLPNIEQYNRWIQTNSPNANYRQSTGYQPIHTDFCRWNGSKYSSGPITKSFDQEHSTYLVSESNDPWAPIGQKELYGTGIRALNNTTQHQVELWVRVDKMPAATEIKTNDGCVIAPQFIEY